MTENQSTQAHAGSGESEPSAHPSKIEKKVELDLDDAPFLEDDEPEPTPEPEKVSAKNQDAAPPPAKPSIKNRLLANKKKLILAGGGAVVLVAVAIAVNMFLFSDGDKPPPPPPVPDPEKVLVTPQPLPPAPVSNFLMQWEPFWVELKDTEGAVRFLTGKFSIPTDNQTLFIEMNVKKLILRDAIFYYLRNQPIISLTDDAKVQTFKSDILTVLNEHLASGKVNELLIEDYLVQ